MCSATATTTQAHAHPDAVPPCTPSSYTRSVTGKRGSMHISGHQMSPERRQFTIHFRAVNASICTRRIALLPLKLRVTGKTMPALPHKERVAALPLVPLVHHRILIQHATRSPSLRVRGVSVDRG